jgi:hypothetical protein
MTNIEVTYSGWIDGVAPSFNIRENEQDNPAIFFTGFDAKDVCDGFTLAEMLAINESMQDAIKLLRLECEGKNQPELFEMNKDAHRD